MSFFLILIMVWIEVFLRKSVSRHLRSTILVAPSRRGFLCTRDIVTVMEKVLQCQSLCLSLCENRCYTLANIVYFIYMIYTRLFQVIDHLHTLSLVFLQNLPREMNY